MADEPDLGGYQPCNGVHAIVACSVTIQFAAPILDERWSDVSGAAFALAEELNLGVPQAFFGLSLLFTQRMLNVAIGTPPAGGSENAGLTFAQVQGDGSLRERIILARDQIAVTDYAYVRWRPFSNRVASIVEALYPAYINSVPFAAAKTEYWDRFDQGSGPSPDATRVIRADSSLVCAGAVSPDAPWHSECGRFERASDSLRRLVYARVDVTETPAPIGTRSTISISTSMQDTVNTPGYTPVDGSEVSAGKALAYVEGQHVALKGLLRDVITPEAADRLGLETS